MSAAATVRRRFLEALLESEVHLDQEGRTTDVEARAVRIDLDGGRAVVRRLWHGDAGLAHIDLPLDRLQRALPELIGRGREWYGLGDDDADAVAALLTALEEAVDSEALDSADDLVLGGDGLFAARDAEPRDG